MGSTGDRNSIIVIEPQCSGFEHVPFNAALLHTFWLAYPSYQIIFCGEQTHIDYVREEIERIHSIERIDFRTIRIPDRKSSDWRRVPLEFSMCNRIFAEILSMHAKSLIFCSVTNTNLLTLKFLMRTKRFNLPTVAVVHGCLSGIAGRQARRPWNWIIGLSRVLALPHPRNLRLIALGDSILNNLVKALPKSKSQWSSLNHVYLWPSNELERCHEPHAMDQPVRFGYLGASSKGFDTFCQLAADVAASKEIAQFIMAGFYSGPAEEKRACQYISDIPDRPFPRKVFEDRVNWITYVVWTAKPDHYRLTASGTFLDALAFMKPGIYLRNDYIEHYFHQMGDIGYLCDSYEEMVSTIREIISEFPTTRYQQQVENIRKGRIIFEPNTVAPRLRDIVESCKVRGFS